MKKLVERAARFWGLEGGQIELAAARENQVYKVTDGAKTYALRLHRSGYRSDREIGSELQMMAVVADAGLAVPTPVKSAQGEFLHTVDGVQADVLTWLAGDPMGSATAPLMTQDRAGLFAALGQEMAKMHMAWAQWHPPQSFARHAWNRNGLVGDTPVWGPFWENPTLTNDQAGLLVAARDALNHQLTDLEQELDYGLIHADLVRENVLIDGAKIHFIDFDDSGFGFRLFDIATTLGKYGAEPDYPTLQAALLKGYLSVRELDMQHLDLFLLLRALTYVGWIIPRLDEPGAAARNRRNIETAMGLLERNFPNLG